MKKVEKRRKKKVWKLSLAAVVFLFLFVFVWRLVAPKEDKTVDLILFSGQSNMSGFGGNAELVPEVTEGAGYEFRAVSDPTRLYPIEEPFGQYELSEESFYDGTLRGGTLVSSFANAYYLKTGVPIVGVNISQGGSNINWWNMEGHYNGALDRLETTVKFLDQEGYQIRHIYMIWIHGENDGADKMSTAEYKEQCYTLFEKFFDRGVEKCMMVPIGDTLATGEDYILIQQADYEMVTENENFVLASLLLMDLGQNYLVDQAHYSQEALNMLGEDIGNNMGTYTITGVSPVDPAHLLDLMEEKIETMNQERGVPNE